MEVIILKSNLGSYSLTSTLLKNFIGELALILNTHLMGGNYKTGYPVVFSEGLFEDNYEKRVINFLRNSNALRRVSQLVFDSVSYYDSRLN